MPGRICVAGIAIKTSSSLRFTWDFAAGSAARCRRPLRQRENLNLLNSNRGETSDCLSRSPEQVGEEAAEGVEDPTPGTSLHLGGLVGRWGSGLCRGPGPGGFDRGRRGRWVGGDRSGGWRAGRTGGGRVGCHLRVVGDGHLDLGVGCPGWHDRLGRRWGRRLQALALRQREGCVGGGRRWAANGLGSRLGRSGGIGSRRDNRGCAGDGDGRRGGWASARPPG